MQSLTPCPGYIAVVSPQRVCVVMSCVCSAVSGVVSATLGTPADVVKSRMMSQQYDINNRGLIFSSSLDCLMSTVSSNPPLYTSLPLPLLTGKTGGILGNI